MRAIRCAALLFIAMSCVVPALPAAGDTPLATLLSEGSWAAVGPRPVPAVELSPSPRIVDLADLTRCADSCTGGAGCCDEATAECNRRWYVSGILGVSFATLSSGGENTAEGGFENAGAVNRSLLTAGGAVGVAFTRANGQLRAEVEGRGRNNLLGVTEGFQPPDATTIYDVRAADQWLVTANLWRDWFLTEQLGWYAGGGLGGGGYRLSVDDGFVTGSGAVGGLAWQAGGGIFYQVNSRITLDLGYRFFQITRTNVPLTDRATGDSSGNFTSLLSANELLLSIRIYEPFARWRR